MVAVAATVEAAMEAATWVAVMAVVRAAAVKGEMEAHLAALGW